MIWLSLIPLLVSGIVGVIFDAKGKLQPRDAWLLGVMGMAGSWAMSFLLSMLSELG